MIAFRGLLQFRNIVSRLPASRVVIISRAISTSKKNKDTITAVEQDVTKKSIGHVSPQTAEDFANPHFPTKYWIGFGFSQKSIAEDRTEMHMMFFLMLTLGLVFVSFFWAYYPDLCMTSWTQREALLELRRREAEGLPLVDPNYVPVENIPLPTEEELGDFEIII